MCSQPGARSGLCTVLFYIEFLADTGLSRGVHGAKGSGSEPSRRGSQGSTGLYHIFCCRVLRWRRCEWWTETWSSKAGTLGIGGAQAMARVWAARTHLAVHCLVFLGLSFHSGNICEWKRVKMLGDGGSYSRPPYVWRGHQSQKKAGVCPRLLRLSTPLKKKKKKSLIQAQPFTDCFRNLCKTTDPFYVFCYGPSSSVYQQIPKIM